MYVTQTSVASIYLFAFIIQIYENYHIVFPLKQVLFDFKFPFCEADKRFSNLTSMHTYPPWPQRWASILKNFKSILHLTSLMILWFLCLLEQKKKKNLCQVRDPSASYVRELSESRLYISSDLGICNPLPHENLKKSLLFLAAF